MAKRTAIIFTGKNQVELVEEPLPGPGPHDLVVKTTHTLISTGTEGIVLARRFAPGTHWDRWVKYPFHPGYLCAGRIEKVGSKVTGWKEGDRVAGRIGHVSHTVVAVGTGQADGSDFNAAAGQCTPSVAIRPIPDNVRDEDAAWMGLGKIVQVGVRAAEHALGDVVVVVGLGLLGQLVVQYARLMGADEVIAIDTAPKRLDMAVTHGATQALLMTAAEALPKVRELSKADGADVVYDVTGHPGVFATALPLARRFGKVVLLGDAGDPSKQTLTPDVVTRGVRIIGAHDSFPPDTPEPYVRWSASQMYDLFLKYLSRGDIRVGDLVTSHFPPEQASKAYELLQHQREQAMGVMFDWPR